jgi:hypothetical protein
MTARRFTTRAAHTWTARAVRALEERPHDLPLDVRWDRLTRFDRCVLGAAYWVDRAVEGALRRGGDSAALVVSCPWTSLDGAIRYLAGLETEGRPAGVINQFAQMGGTSTYHYVAKCLGVRGYATVLVEAHGRECIDDVVEDVRSLGELDWILDVRARLRWETRNRVLERFTPAVEEVEVSLEEAVR